MIIRGNVAYNNRNFAPFYQAGKITDGNGIIIDDLTQLMSGLGIYHGRTMIENNIVYKNGGRGIHAFESDPIDIINNTTYQNSQIPNIQDGEITVEDHQDRLTLSGNLSFNDLTIRQQGHNTLLRVDQHDFILLRNTESIKVTATDFK